MDSAPEAVPAVIPTKIAPPPPRRCADRPRLMERFEEAADADHVLVIAPAGYGKSTAVRAWADAAVPAGALGWLTLDRDDTDEAGLFGHLQAVLSGLGAPRVSDAGDPLAAVVAAMCEVAGPVTVVIDGLQPAHPDALRRAVAKLVQHAPAGVRLVLTSRCELPGLPPALELSGSLARIDTTDLRLRPEETARMFADRGPELGRRHQALIEEHAEGWIAGVRTALALHAQGRLGNRIDGAAEPFRRFFRGEVLDQLDLTARQVAVDSSMLPRISAAALENLLGRPEPEVLRRIHESGAFLFPAESPEEFRFHGLFRDALRAELRELGDRHLRRRARWASDWLASGGDAAGAIGHALDSRDYTRAVDLMRAHADRFLAAGKGTAVHGWFSRLPPQLTASPELAGDFAWSLAFHGEPYEAQAWLDRIGPDAQPLVRMHAAGLRVFTARTLGDLDAAVQLAPAALAAADEIAAAEAQFAAVARAMVHIQLAVAFTWQGRPGDAEHAARRALAVAAECEHPSGGVRSRGLLAQLSVLFGRLGEAEGLCRAGEGLAAQHDLKQDTAFAEVLLAKAGLMLERDEVEEAEAAARAALRIVDERVWPHTAATGLLLLARIAAARGCPAQAARHLDTAATANPHRVTDEAIRRVVSHERALLELRAGHLDTARPWLAEALRTARDDRQRHLLAAHAAGAADAADVSPDVESAVKALLTDLRSDGPPRPAVEAHLAAARWSAAQGDEQSAMAHLIDALRIAEREGLLRSVAADLGELEPLLASLTERGATPPPSPGYAARLLDVLHQARAPRPGGSRAGQLLTAQELAVARLLVQNRSNDEIAAECFLSVNTIKTHLRHIYRKLAVPSRRAARERLTELGVGKNRSGAA